MWNKTGIRLSSLITHTYGILHTEAVPFKMACMAEPSKGMLWWGNGPKMIFFQPK